MVSSRSHFAYAFGAATSTPPESPAISQYTASHEHGEVVTANETECAKTISPADPLRYLCPYNPPASLYPGEIRNDEIRLVYDVGDDVYDALDVFGLHNTGSVYFASGFRGLTTLHF